MKELYKYGGKKVKVIDTDGEVHVGKVLGTTSDIDNEEGEESIDIQTNSEARMGVELFESEIKSIEIIED